MLALALGACSGGGMVGPSTPATAAAGATIVQSATTTAGPQDTDSSAPQPTASCATPTFSTGDLGRLARAGPSSGVWVGMNLDWGSETVADVTGRLGSPPATVVSFVSFPLTSDDGVNLQAAARQARDAGAILIVTLQPWGGLAAVTAGVAADLATRLAGFGADGVPTIIRFAHEMNGSWYPWGQDPVAYVAAFRRVADAVHASAPTAATLWAPNQGDGYPYAGGQFPWGANTVPAAGKFAQMVSGSTPPSAVRVPDFYAGYAERYGKPLAIVETAALYRPGGGGQPSRPSRPPGWRRCSPPIRARASRCCGSSTGSSGARPRPRCTPSSTGGSRSTPECARRSLPP